MKRIIYNYYGIFLIMSVLLLPQNSFAQLDTLHYLPPTYDSSHQTFRHELHIAFTNPNASSASVTVKSGNGRSLYRANIAANSTVRMDVPGTGNAQTGFTKQAGRVLSDQGMVVESSLPIYVTYHLGFAPWHNEMYTSKGRYAMGQKFRLGAHNSTVRGTGRFFVSVMATQNQTKVNLSEMGGAANIQLNKGDSYIATATVANRFIGSLVSADKPVVVVSGSSQLLNEKNQYGSDDAYDQIAPEGATGKEYILAKMGSGPSTAILVSHKQNTRIYLDNRSTPSHTLNAGKFAVIPVGSAGRHIRSSENIFVYQIIGEQAPGGSQHGLFFVPPNSCYNQQNKITIPPVPLPGIEQYDIQIIALKEADVRVDGRSLTVRPSVINGAKDYVYYVLNVAYNRQHTITTNKGGVTVAARAFLSQGNGASFYSGFGAAPDSHIEGSCATQLTLKSSTDFYDSFQWYVNGEAISGATQNSLIPEKIGSYTVSGFSEQCSGGSLHSFPLNVTCAAVPDYDYSDAPASYGIARHTLTSRNPYYLGELAPDKDNRFQGSALADHDDQSGVDDDDGLSTLSLGLGEQRLDIPVIGKNGHLQMWVDWNQNGVFDDAEQVIRNLQDQGKQGDLKANDGVLQGVFNTPASLASRLKSNNRFYTRLRWAEKPGVAATGIAKGGEVEDYLLTFQDTTLCELAAGSTKNHADSDCDGIPNTLEWGLIYNELGVPLPFPQDTDGDGIFDEKDRDSDNDGIYDAEEAGHGLPHKNGRVLGPRDEYGLPVAVIGSDGALTYNLLDSDSNGQFDFQSTDADGDACYDVLEAPYLDPDNNGLLGLGREEDIKVDEFGVVLSENNGYLEPRKTRGRYDFQNSAVTACQGVVANKAPVIAVEQVFTLLRSQVALENYVLGVVAAIDPDNDRLQNWQIRSDSSGGGFTIDTGSGQLRVADQSKLLLGSYTLEVVVEDHKGLQAEKEKLTITLSRQPNLKPVFTSRNQVNFPERESGFVLDVDSEDDKDTEEGGLRYELIAGAGSTDNALFHLSANDGRLRFRNKPYHDIPSDADGNNVHEVRVRVCDSAGGCAEQAIKITVTKVAALRLNVRAYLAGAFRSRRGEDVAASVKMVDDLRIAGLLPLSQPFHEQPIAYPDTESKDAYQFIQQAYDGYETTTKSVLEQSGRNAVVDWVLVELRKTRDLSVVVAQQAALLQRDGDVSTAENNRAGLSFENLPAGDYYVSLRHRNHLGVMAADKVYLSADPILVDFTHKDLAVTRMRENLPARVTARNGTVLLWVGDVDADNWISSQSSKSFDSDIKLIKNLIKTNKENTRNNANKTLVSYHPADVNMDGKVIYSGKGSDSVMIYGMSYYFRRTFKFQKVPGGMQMP